MNILCRIVGHNWSKPIFTDQQTYIETCHRYPETRKDIVPVAHEHDWTGANKDGVKRCKTCPATALVKRRVKVSV